MTSLKSPFITSSEDLGLASILWEIPLRVEIFTKMLLLDKTPRAVVSLLALAPQLSRTALVKVIVVIFVYRP